MKLLLIVILLVSCGRDKTITPPVLPETFEQRLFRNENVTCDQITYHDYGDPPDCEKVYAAWIRGRNRVAKVYPAASGILMATISFYRPKLTAVPELPYPLLADLPGNPRGITYVLGGVQITYAYEEVIEHEATHALVFIVDGLKTRDEIAAERDMGGYRPEDFRYIPFYFYLITCHGTSDDPFGEPERRASCLEPFSGLPDWRIRIQP